MSSFVVDIATDNDAFQPVPGPQLATLLRRAADEVEKGNLTGMLRDDNGNTVGAFNCLP